MDTSSISRRSILVGTAAAAAILPLRKVIAQTASAGGTWFDMIKAQHVLILNQVATVLANDVPYSPQREVDLAQLSYLLLAHNSAEENTVYATMALIGMTTGADLLYLEQSLGKVANAKVDSDAIIGTGPGFMADVQALQAGLMEHAKVHEEGDYFPKLFAALTPAQNAQLTADYQIVFNAVSPSL